MNAGLHRLRDLSRALAGDELPPRSVVVATEGRRLRTWHRAIAKRRSVARS